VCRSGACSCCRVFAASTCAPDVDAGEKEQPDHVNEVPVPSRSFEAEVLLWRKGAAHGADQTYCQEDRADEHVRSMEPSCHEKGRAIAVAGVSETGVAVLDGLADREQCTEHNRGDRS
jgi:hypothetical protein